MNEVRLKGTVTWAAHRATSKGDKISNVRLRCIGASTYAATVDCDFWKDHAEKIQSATKGDIITCRGEVRNKPAREVGRWKVVINITAVESVEKGDPAAAGAEHQNAPAPDDDDMPF
jgi:hypothetical protein